MVRDQGFLVEKGVARFLTRNGRQRLIPGFICGIVGMPQIHLVAVLIMRARFIVSAPIVGVLRVHVWRQIVRMRIRRNTRGWRLYLIPGHPVGGMGGGGTGDPNVVVIVARVFPLTPSGSAASIRREPAFLTVPDSSIAIGDIAGSFFGAIVADRAVAFGGARDFFGAVEAEGAVAILHRFGCDGGVNIGVNIVIVGMLYNENLVGVAVGAPNCGERRPVRMGVFHLVHVLRLVPV
mmetsp:Transcript_31508/g.36366  ORF Transcript_31508/g.36366 Transcript_31508/m.36366 type:complete len:236 (-) Transcript_31508:1462-2169(-)